MVKTRPKAPADSKAALMEDVARALEDKFGVNCGGAALYLLNYFTSIDLVGIRDDLRREK